MLVALRRHNRLGIVTGHRRRRSRRPLGVVTSYLSLLLASRRLDCCSSLVPWTAVDRHSLSLGLLLLVVASCLLARGPLLSSPPRVVLAAKAPSSVSDIPACACQRMQKPQWTFRLPLPFPESRD
jgi:hypothetical protein